MIELNFNVNVGNFYDSKRDVAYVLVSEIGRPYCFMWKGNSGNPRVQQNDTGLIKKDPYVCIEDLGSTNVL